MFGWLSEARTRASRSESPQAVRIVCEIRGQELDGHLAIEPGVARPIDLAHAAFADERSQDIGPEPGPFAARAGHLACERLHAVAEQRSILLGQQRLHLVLQRGITVAGLREKGAPLVRRTLARVVKELLDTAPVRVAAPGICRRDSIAGPMSFSASRLRLPGWSI